MALAAHCAASSLELVRLGSFPREIWVPRGPLCNVSLEARVLSYFKSRKWDVFPSEIAGIKSLSPNKHHHVDQSWNSLLICHPSVVSVESSKIVYHIQGQQLIRASLWVNATDTYSVYVKGHGAHVMRLAPKPWYAKPGGGFPRRPPVPKNGRKECGIRHFGSCRP